MDPKACRPIGTLFGDDDANSPGASLNPGVLPGACDVMSAARSGAPNLAPARDQGFADSLEAPCTNSDGVTVSIIRSTLMAPVTVSYFSSINSDAAP